MEIGETGKGCLLVPLAILPIILPWWILDSPVVMICGAIAMGLGLAPNLITNPKDNTFRKEFPFTVYFVWVLFAYAFVTTIAVGFADITYEEMRAVGKAILCYIVYPIIAFVIESKSKRNMNHNN
jgi:hypothetical protein